MKPRTRAIVETLQAFMRGDASPDVIERSRQIIESFTGAAAIKFTGIAPLPVRTAPIPAPAPKRTSRAKAAPAVIATDVDTASMTDAQLFAHYKRTSLLGDVEFFLQHSRPAGDVLQGLEALASELRTRAHRPADRLAYVNLTQRHWSQATDKRTHTPCSCEVGTLAGSDTCSACGFTLRGDALASAVKLMEERRDAAAAESDAGKEAAAA